MFDPNLYEAARAQQASTEAAYGLRNDIEAYEEYRQAEIAEDFSEELHSLGVIAIEGQQNDGLDA